MRKAYLIVFLFFGFTTFTNQFFSQDVGVESITTQNSACDYQYNQAVTVVVRDYSGIGISGTVTLTYQLNGGPTVSQSTALSIGGGGSTSFTFAQQINGTTNGSFVYGANTIVATATTATDFTPGNNAATKNFTNSAPTVGGSVTSNATVCAGSNGGTLTLAGHTGTILNWEFSTNSGASWTSIANATTTQTYSNLSTTTIYRASVKNGFCTTVASVPATITVNQIPPTPDATSNGPICEGSTLNLFASNENGSNYSWTGPNGFTSTLQNPSIVGATAAASGTYQVTNTFNGCTSQPGFRDVVVNAVPPGVNASGNTPACEQGTLNLTSDAVAGATYSWTGPNGFTSSQQNPVINNLTVGYSGVYTAFVTKNGCVGPSSNVNIVVNPNPATPVVNSNSPICTGETINLTSQSNAGSTYAWTGPNGFTSALQNPSVPSATSAAAGSYSVTATLNGCVSASNFTIVNVKNTPAAPVPSSNTPVCEGQSLNLTANTVTSAIYNWTGPNGFSSSIQSPQISPVTLAAGGQYDLVVTVNGCTSPIGSTNVTINPKPAAPTVGSNSPVCSGNDINLTSNLVASATYAWTGPGGYTASVQNPTRANAIAAYDGNYSLTVSVLGCISDAATTTVVVNQTPTAPAISSNAPICEGSSLNLSTPAVSGGTYAWTGPAAFSSALQNPTIAAATSANSGAYSLTVTVLGCTSPVSNANLTVNPTPATPTATSNTPVCVGDSIKLFSTAIAGATYSWSGPNGYTASVKDPIIPVANANHAGTYNLTAFLGNCPSAVSSTTLVIRNLPATPSPSSNSPVCEGGNLDLVVQTVATATYSWTGPNGFTSTTQNPSIIGVTPVNGGFYNVNVTVNGCKSLDGTVNAVIRPKPATPVPTSNSPVCEADTLLLTVPAVTGASYNWTGPSGFNSSAQNPQINSTVPANAGVYSLVVTTNSCTSDAGTVNVTITPRPAAPVISSNSPVCVGEDIQLESNTIVGATYIWTGPNGFTSNQEDPLIVGSNPNHAGTYSMYVVVGSCESLPSSLNVTVKPIPATPNPSSNSPVCETGTINLNTATVTGATYSWSGPNGFTSALKNPTISNVTAVNDGFYSVNITVNGCTSLDGSVNVSVKPKPGTPAPNSNSPVCETGTLSLTTANVLGGSYSWTGPNGFVSANQNPQINNVSSVNGGVYSLVVTVNGCSSDVGTTTVNITPKPAPPSLSSNSAVCSGQSINLMANLVASATYSWTGPNSFTSVAQNPTIPNATSADAGVYYATVTVSGCTSDQGQTNVVINPTPVAPSTSSNTPLCEGQTLNLSTPLVTGASYSWSGPAGFSSTLREPSVSGTTSTNAGAYNLFITVNGCVSPTSTENVSINPTPGAVAGGSNSPLCQGSNLNLTGSFIAGATYSWTGPNSFTSVNQNPTINNVNLSHSGTYFVSASIGGCQGVASPVSVTVKPKPVTPTASSNSPVCEGTNLNLVGSTHAGATYDWFGPNAFTSPNQSPSIGAVTPANAGVYYLAITVNGCTSDTASTNVNVNPTPAAPVASSNSAICAGQTLQLESNSFTGGIFNWTGPNGFSGSAEDPSIANATTAASGFYQVTVTVNNCTSAPGGTNVTVKATPAPPVVSNTSPTCEGLSFTLTVNAVASASYAWTGPNGYNSPFQNPTRTNADQSMAGDYFVVITVNGCSSVPGTTNVQIISVPTPTASSDAPKCVGDNVQLMASNLAGATYSWTGPGFTSPVQNPILTNVTQANAGIYSVTYTINGCTSQPGSTQVTIDNNSVGGKVGPDTTVCATNNNGVLVLTGHTGNVNQWEYSINNGTNWSLMAGNTPVNNYGNLTTNTLFRTLVQNGNCPAVYSQSAVITVIGEADAGYIVGDNPDPNHAVCPEDNAGELYLKKYSGMIDMWEYSQDEGKSWLQDFNTTDTYSYLNIPTTSWYRAIVSGCSTTDTSQVFVLTTSYDACDRMIIANLLTPNGDGKNDTWMIENIETYPTIEVTVFNRLGKEVYRNAKYDNSWAGDFQGNPLQDGAYYYILKMEGVTEIIKGSINIMH